MYNNIIDVLKVELMRQLGFGGTFFIKRKIMELEKLDYYPPELIINEYIESKCFDFKETDFKAYRIDDEMYIDIFVPNDFSQWAIDEIDQDLEFCYYKRLTTSNSNVLKYKSTIKPQLDKFPEELFFFCSSLERYASNNKCLELYDSENITDAVRNAYDTNITHGDTIRQFKIYKIPFKDSNAVHIQKSIGDYYISFKINSEKAKLISYIESFLRKH